MNQKSKIISVGYQYFIDDLTKLSIYEKLKEKIPDFKEEDFQIENDEIFGGVWYDKNCRAIPQQNKSSQQELMHWFQKRQNVEVMYLRKIFIRKTKNYNVLVGYLTSASDSTYIILRDPKHSCTSIHKNDALWNSIPSYEIEKIPIKCKAYLHDETR